MTEPYLSLTESKLKDLIEKKFDTLYTKHKAEWTEATDNAFVFVRDNITDGRRPRQDDVLKVLLPTLESNETLRKHQEQHHARFKHHREAFGEYMIDLYYQKLEPER